MPLILMIQQVAGLVQAGIASYAAIKSKVAEGKAIVHSRDGVEITADELDQHYEALLRHAAEVGDAAAAGLEELSKS